MGGHSPHPFSNSFTSPKIKSLRYNTSQKGSPVAVCFGTQRVGMNVIGGFGFTGGTSGGKKGGGKGGGGGGKKRGTADYTVNVAAALCEGPIAFTGAPGGFGGSNRVWSNGGISNAGALPLNYYVGDDGQLPDPVFESSSGDPPILGYSGTAYFTGTPLDLGSTPALPNAQFEITGFGAGTAGADFPGDARPDWPVVGILTDSRFGIGFPMANLDTGGAWDGGGSVADFGIYCQAAGLAVSYLCDRQRPASQWIEDLADQCNAAVVWSGTLLKIIPYGDVALSAHGVSWTPDLTWRYSLSDSDFLPWSAEGGAGSDPVLITRIDPSQATNWMGAEYENTVDSYNREVVPVFDQALIDQYGVRAEPSVQADPFTNIESATSSVQLRLQRKAYIRSTYKFKLGWRHSLLEPMDIVLLNDSTLGLSGAAVRITQIEEDENGELTISAEEIPGVTP